MKVIKTKSSKYPRKVIFDNGAKVPIPNQKAFKTSYINRHGCSLVAFYIALRFGGGKKKLTNLLKWSRKNLTGYFYSKLTIKGVARGLKKLGVKAVYHKKPTFAMVNGALARGKMVLLELGGPIHTTVLYRSKKNKTYRFDHGKRTKCSTKQMVSKATDSKRYRGCVIIG